MQLVVRGFQDADDISHRGTVAPELLVAVDLDEPVRSQGERLRRPQKRLVFIALDIDEYEVRRPEAARKLVDRQRVYLEISPATTAVVHRPVPGKDDGSVLARD